MPKLKVFIFTNDHFQCYFKISIFFYKPKSGQYFVTVADIKELSNFKNDSALRKALVCLRHCKRIREIRGNPPKLIRYALI